MAELTLSIVPLVSLFQTCLELYDNIVSTKDLKGDLHFYSTCVAFERRKLVALRNTFNERKPQQYPVRLVKEALDCMKETLSETNTYLIRHGTVSISAMQDVGAVEVDALVAPKLKHSRTNPMISIMKKPVKVSAWLGYDKERLKELLSRLQTMNENLRSLTTPSEQAVMDFRLLSSAISTDDPVKLEDLRSDYGSQYPEVSIAADLKILTLQSQDTALIGTVKSSVERCKRSIYDIEWMKLSLDKAAARLHTGKVSLTQVISLEKAFGMFSTSPNCPKLMHMVEWRDGFDTQTSAAECEERLDRLVATLQSMYQSSTPQPPTDFAIPRSVDFSIMKCVGWTMPQDNFNRLGLIFACPKDGLLARPMTLRERIHRDRDPREKRHAPPLGVRFDLAYGLAQVVANMVTIGWVHKNLRSENVCFFDDNTATMRRFFLTGFTYARPGDVAEDLSRLPNHNKTYQLYRPPQFALDKAGLTKDGCRESSNQDGPEANWARHITSAFDIYGLGVILIELGLWWTIETLKGPKTVGDFHGPHGALNELVESLSYRMGDIYANVVRDCLNPAAWAGNNESEYEFIAKVLQYLGHCKA